MSFIRTAFIPRENALFYVADFSAIEARVIAWFAGESWRQQVFEKGGDIYCASASQMFKVPVEKHGINGYLRQKGKIAELALGYGGSVGALYSRTEITDTEVRRYASFGTVNEHIAVSDASSVCARIIWSQNGTRTVTGAWRISYKSNFDNGNDYTFSSSTDTMIKIDSLSPDVEKSVSGTEHIDDYFNENQCSPSQQNAIKKMFMIKQ